ncbi:MAG: helix-turn-helix domain-containing protein [Lachnospiraceae bacterium]|nr:helix-turn-helix domain-containing protein [Lachnospiraceae bacterium]
MKEINIAKTLISKRKEKGVTQDELAEFIGVSRASVSKWETGHSYPDIVFLPQLATFFNITMDELMGYEPQMTDKDIRKLFTELVEEFGAKPFAEVKNRIDEIAKKYFSCFPLLFQLGVLFTNYGMAFAIDEEVKNTTLTEAKKLFIRVKNESGNTGLRQIALYYEATCEMMLKNPVAIIDLLKDVSPAPPKEELLAQAYLMTGKIKEAKTALQKLIYNNIMWVLYALPIYLTANANEPEQFGLIYERSLSLIKNFNLKELAPTFIMPIFFNAAQAYASLGETEKALNALERYTEIATGGIYPLKLFKNDDFFNLIDESVQKGTFGITSLPRDEKSIKQGMADEVIGNPEFAALSKEPRFKSLVEKLKQNIVN